MIEITKEMKDISRKRMAEVEIKVDNQIRRAIERGENQAYFACDIDGDSDVYSEIRAKYEKAGYRIVPTGYIGGVRQRTEHICW